MAGRENTKLRGDPPTRCATPAGQVRLFALQSFWYVKSSYALRNSGVTWESESDGEKRQKLSTLDPRLSTLHFGKIIDSKIIGEETTKDTNFHEQPTVQGKADSLWRRMQKAEKLKSEKHEKIAVIKLDYRR